MIRVGVMKRFLRVVISIIIMSNCIFLLTSCGKDKKDSQKDYSNEVASAIIEVLKNHDFEESKISVEPKLYSSGYSYIYSVDLAVDGFSDREVNEMIFIKSELNKASSFFVGEDKVTYVLVYIYDGTDSVYINIDNFGQTIYVDKNITKTLFSFEEICLTPYKKLSNAQKYRICKHIERRYEYYDEKDGKYTGEKYTSTIWREMQKEYNKTKDEIDLIWYSYYYIKGNYSSENDNILPSKFKVFSGDDYIEVELNKNYVISPVEKEGFEFLGYFTQSEGGEQITDSEGNSLEKWDKPYSIKVYAHYLEITE